MENTMTVETIVKAPIERVWDAWTNPEHVTKWNAASNDWHCPRGTNDLREGGNFSFRMEARDGSMGFDFGGIYTTVIPYQRIAYTMGEDGRAVDVSFEPVEGGVRITETFDMEHENSAELQRVGWQSILDRFKQYVEQLA